MICWISISIGIYNHRRNNKDRDRDNDNDSNKTGTTTPDSNKTGTITTGTGNTITTGTTTTKTGQQDNRTTGQGEINVEQHTVKIDNAPDLNFTGELIAETSSRCDQSDRWTELKLYRTRGGNFICQSIGRTTRQAELDRFSGAVCSNTGEVLAFFGHRWLAKQLYRSAGICDAVTVE